MRLAARGARLLLAAAAAAAFGADRAAAAPSLTEAPPGALSCSGCHAARLSAETSVPIIRGRPAAEIVAALDAFRAGTRPATLMNRIAPGFTPDESRAIAAWLSAQKVDP